MAKKRITVNDFYCTKCGNKGLPLPRRQEHLRNTGHLKNLYCIYCKDCHNHAEVNVRTSGGYTRDSFLMEYQGGNFAEDGTRKLPYNQFLSKVREGEIKIDESILENIDWRGIKNA